MTRADNLGGMRPQANSHETDVDCSRISMLIPQDFIFVIVSGDYSGIWPQFILGFFLSPFLFSLPLPPLSTRLPPRVASATSHLFPAQTTSAVVAIGRPGYTQKKIASHEFA